MFEWANENHSAQDVVDTSRQAIYAKASNAVEFLNAQQALVVQKVITEPKEIVSSLPSAGLRRIQSGKEQVATTAASTLEDVRASPAATQAYITLKKQQIGAFLGHYTALVGENKYVVDLKNFQVRKALTDLEVDAFDTVREQAGRASTAVVGRGQTIADGLDRRVRSTGNAIRKLPETALDTADRARQEINGKIHAGITKLTEASGLVTKFALDHSPKMLRRAVQNLGEAKEQLSKKSLGQIGKDTTAIFFHLVKDLETTRPGQLVVQIFELSVAAGGKSLDVASYLANSRLGSLGGFGYRWSGGERITQS